MNIREIKNAIFLETCTGVIAGTTKKVTKHDYYIPDERVFARTNEDGEIESYGYIRWNYENE